MNNTPTPNTRKIQILLFGLLTIHVCLSLYYGSRLPYGGDEWFTWDKPYAIRARPYFLLVNLSKFFLGPLTGSNLLLYRQWGLIWGIATLFLLMRTGLKGTSLEKRVSIFHFIYFCFGSFILFQEQFFRYYGFYAFCSFLLFYLLWKWDADYGKKRIPILVLFILSPFAHVALTWQLFCYLLIKEFSLLSRQLKKILLITIVPGFLIAGLTWKSWTVFLPGLISKIFFLEDTLPVMRGYNWALLIKPFYSIFEFTFGYQLEPTEYPILLAAFILLGLGCFYKLYRIALENKKLFHFLLIAGFIPFFSLHAFVEPLTLQGMTQFVSKHTLFFLPFFLTLLTPLENKINRFLSIGLSVLFFLCVAAGSIASFSKPRENWNRVIQMALQVQSRNGLIVVGDRSKIPFSLYSAGKIDETRVVNMDKVIEDPNLIDQVPSVLLVVKDWPGYQPITKRQKWNSRNPEVHSRWKRVSVLFQTVHKTDKNCTASYGLFPLYAFQYEDPQTKPAFSKPKPAYFDLPYKDIVLPIHQKGTSILGCQSVTQENPFYLENNQKGVLDLYYFIRSRKLLPKSAPIGEIRSPLGKIQLALGKTGNSYLNHFSRSFETGSVWANWRKTPTPTYSLRYPGFLWPSKGHVYQSSFEVGAEAKLTVQEEDVTIYICDADFKSISYLRGRSN